VQTEDRRFTLILPRDIRAALRRRAHADGNSESATARAIIAHALAEERAQAPQDERKSEGEA